MSERPCIEDAILLATAMHRGQTDKAGLPYILHPLRVMGSFLQPAEDEERMASVLHDVVEDTKVTFQMLLDLNFPPCVVEAIDALTKRGWESYPEYIERAGKNPVALRVKLADLKDNLNPGRKSTKALDMKTVTKYSDAHKYLTGVQSNADPSKQCGQPPPTNDR